MSLPLPTQAELKPKFSLDNLRSRAGARFAILGLTVFGVVYYLAAPDPYRPDLAWGRERPYPPPPPPAWDIDFDHPPPPPHAPPKFEGGGEGGSSGTVVPGASMPERAEAVRKAFKHGYNGYERVAWGFDELLPNTDATTNK
jgi:hypothetical protein